MTTLTSRAGAAAGGGEEAAGILPVGPERGGVGTERGARLPAPPPPQALSGVGAVLSGPQPGANLHRSSPFALRSLTRGHPSFSPCGVQMDAAKGSCFFH